MNTKEKALIIEFLEELNDRFSKDVCNDWRFPANWSDEEIRELFNSTQIGSELTNDGFPIGRITMNVVVLDMLIEKFKKSM